MCQRQDAQRQPVIKVIDTHYLHPNLAASHLFIEKGEALFVDTGTAQGTHHLLAALDDAGVSTSAVRYIFLTHIHLDHAGGAGALLRHCPQATLLVHPRGVEHLVDPARLIEASVKIYGKELFAKLYGTITPVARDRVRAIEDETVISWQGRNLHFFDTPGHARHHLSMWDPAAAIIFSGDTMGLAYRDLQLNDKPPFLVPTTSPAAFDPQQLEQSINRLMALQPRTLYLTHFGPVAAHRESVDRLINLVRQHARIGMQALSPEPQLLAPELRQLLISAYHGYCHEHECSQPVPDEAVTNLLSGDIALNAQGIAAWQMRLREGTKK